MSPLDTLPWAIVTMVWVVFIAAVLPDSVNDKLQESIFGKMFNRLARVFDKSRSPSGR